MTGTSVIEKSGTLNYTLKVPAGTHKSRNEYYATPAVLVKQNKDIKGIIISQRENTFPYMLTTSRLPLMVHQNRCLQL
jgi:hypothetical protein